MDPSGFDNPHEALVGARRAAEMLGVKPATLYSYVSRGWVRALPGGGHRERLYPVDDLRRLRRRADARLGHEAVAGGALRWGEPVLSSSITELRPDGPWYRGRAAVALAATASFEAVAELLWTDRLPDERPDWTSAKGRSASAPPRAPALCRTVAARASDPLSAMLAGLAARRALGGPRPEGRPDDARPALVHALVDLLAAWTGRPAPRAAPVAVRLRAALGLAARPEVDAAIEMALVLSADHELNASSFAARVAASTAADLDAALLAALATFTGPRHGAESARVQAFLEEVGPASRAESALQARLRRGEAVPGFAHPLYRAGDPRATALLDRARRLGSRRAPVRTLLAVVDAAARAGLDGPTLDFGLLALAHALGAPPWAAAATFCIGRSAGWIAHAEEQRRSGELLRPRARFVPSAP